MIIPILILGFLVRLINLNQSLWLDEAINTVAIKENSLLNLITRYALGDFHPPLYHFLLFYWTRFAGFSEISVRFPSVVFGVGLIFFTYLIGKDFFSQKAGIYGGLLIAFGPLAVYYSQEARMYTVAAFFASASIYFFLKLLKRNKFYLWGAYILSTLFLLYSDYLPYSVWLLENLYVARLWQTKKADFKNKWIASQFMIIVMLLPWVPFFITQFQNAQNVVRIFPLWGDVVGKGTLTSLPLALIKFTIGRISYTNKAVYALMALPVMIWVASLFIKLWHNQKNRLNDFLWWWFIGPLLISYFISFKISVFSYFRFIFILPAFYLLLANGILSLKGKYQSIALFLTLGIGATSLFIFNVNPVFWREDWRGAVSYIDKHLADKQSLIVMPNLAQEAPVKYYETKGLSRQDVSDLRLNGMSEIWLFRYVQQIFDPGDTLRQTIELKGFKKVEENNFNSIIIWRYVL